MSLHIHSLTQRYKYIGALGEGAYGEVSGSRVTIVTWPRDGTGNAVVRRCKVHLHTKVLCLH